MGRHRDAIAIQDGGACNPSGIAHSLLAAIRECREQRLDACNDPAVRLMVHQLAWITKADSLDTGNEWDKAMAACREAIAQEHFTKVAEAQRAEPCGDTESERRVGRYLG